MLENFPAGRKVRVFYDPQNPDNAVLERCTYDPKQCFILGTIFIFLMILMLTLIVIWWVNQKQVVFDLLLNKAV